MKLLDLYYLVKPAIPHSVRLQMRQILANRKRAKTGDTWPISASAATPPRSWPGWPDGKQFAFALSHDVEGQKGMERSRALADLESSLGFRSSFNFVPEGEYRTPLELRSSLTRDGFEVGVHDLHHDGTLYRSRAEFDAAAQRINRHLAEWGAVGFRSAFMFHNLEWLKALNVLYDASTFDTDPFEPQPDGMNTIFPFWVPRGDGSGYVELPYTLAQDSTLFLVLREQSNAIWKQKLDWVAAHGGLALVNVHPDYLAFDNQSRPTEFPVTHYSGLLEYARERYGDRAWFARPCDVASYVQPHVAALSA